MNIVILDDASHTPKSHPPYTFLHLTIVKFDLIFQSINIRILFFYLINRNDYNLQIVIITII